MVRLAVSEHDGAEVKTEGDSFFVVFGSVSQAVECALAIVSAARFATEEHPEDPISVGIGVHAGETVRTDEGYVGTAVNMAARLCSVAGAGEVLVSDTVRALVFNTMAVTFRSVGRRRLKGIAEPVVVYHAIASDTFPAGRARAGRPSRLMLAAIGGGTGLVLLALAAVVLLDPGREVSGMLPSASESDGGGGDRSEPVMVELVSREDPGFRPQALTPGQYRFSQLSPTVAFEISDGNWRAYRDYLDAAGLELLEAGITEYPTGIDNYIGWISFGRIQVVFANGCISDESLLLEATPNAFVAWLQEHDWLEATDPTPVNFGGHSGIAIDVTARSLGADEDPCADDGDVPRTILFPVGEDIFSLFPDERLRVITLDVGGSPFSVLVNSSTERWDEFLEAATPVLDSIRVGP
jgi:hypothetical protein